MITHAIRGLLFSLTIGLASSGFAQANTPASETQPEMLERARAHHEAGLAALEAGQLEVAETNFRAALAIAPRSSTAYNLGLVLFDRDGFTEALGLFDQVLSGELGDLPVDAEQIRSHRAEAVAAQAVLTLRSTHVRALNIEIDGEAHGTLNARVPLRVGLDPGPHEVSGEDDDGGRAESRVTLARGERASLALEVLDLADTADDANSGDAATPRRRWPIAIVITSMLLVAGGALALGLTLRSGNDDRFREDPIPNVEALRLPW